MRTRPQRNNHHNCTSHAYRAVLALTRLHNGLKTHHSCAGKGASGLPFARDWQHYASAILIGRSHGCAMAGVATRNSLLQMQHATTNSKGPYACRGLSRFVYRQHHGYNRYQRGTRLCKPKRCKPLARLYADAGIRNLIGGRAVECMIRLCMGKSLLVS